MSVKLHKRLSSKKKKFANSSAQADVLCNLGLEAFKATPLDPASMLNISTWALENHVPSKLSDLPYAFLRRLWLLSPDARSPCISSPSADVEIDLKLTDIMMNDASGDKDPIINPLDLITAIFMSSNTFLQQEIVTRMVRCHFAVPLVLPNVDPEQNGHFLLWPLRSAFSQWSSFSPDQNTYILHEGDLASTPMPLVSCVRLGHCDISKSQVLNHLMLTDMFLHKGMPGGQEPRRLANGLVEIGWCLPNGNAAKDVFPVPVMLANLRGEAGPYEKSLTVLCQASSVLVVFAGNLREKERQLLNFCKKTARKLIVIDVSDSEEREDNIPSFIEQDLAHVSVLEGKNVDALELAKRLRDQIKLLLANQITHVTLLAVAQLASELDLLIDEGPVCRKAMAQAEQVLEGLDEGSTQYQEKQLVLQGPLWRQLAVLEKEESKQIKANTDIDLEGQRNKNEIINELSSYKITPAMKTFIDALFTNDKTERTYFLNWMKLKLSQIQAKNPDMYYNLQNSGQVTGPENRIYDDPEDSDSFCTDSSFEEETLDESAVNVEQQNEHKTQVTFEGHNIKKQVSPTPEPFVLGLQHFLREMGLIYQLTHIRPASMSHNVLRLPTLAVDLLLYGVPLEIMDGNASNIPMQWLGSVLSELQRRLPQEQQRTRVLTSLGAHSTRNAEVLSAIFSLKFAEERKQCSKGIYMLALCVPSGLQSDLQCDFLLLLNVEGLCSENKNRDFDIQDNEMTTVATALSDILIENISSHSSSKFDIIFSVIVSSLLRTSECASVPTCQIVSHDEEIKTILQALQLNRISEILQMHNEVQKRLNPKTTTVIGPWYNESLSKPVNPQYGSAVMALKKNLFKAIKEPSRIQKASCLPLFMECLRAVWDAVKADAFTVSLQNTDIALSFSILCAELSQWENTLEEHMEGWLMEAIKKICASKSRTLDAIVPNELLNQLMDEAKAKVITEVDAVTIKLEAYWIKDQYLKMYSHTLKPAVTSNIDELRKRVTKTIILRLQSASEDHCFSTQLKTFETQFKKEQELKICQLIENSKATKILQDDTKLEEEFEIVWSNTISNVDLRPVEIEDITPRVMAMLRKNLISRGLHKHIKKIEKIGQNQPTAFQIQDEHFLHPSRLKHMFEDHRKNIRSQAQKIASHIIDEYNQFVAEKSSLLLDFSDSYTTELLHNIEKTLTEKNIDMRSGFEVDIKVYLCSVACKDFQKLHNNYAKDKNLLATISGSKTEYLAGFIYQFRKRDQGHRVAQAFTSLVIKPMVLDYIYTPLGMQIVKEIQNKSPHYRSPRAFYQNLLKELIYDQCTNSDEFLFFYQLFSQKKIQEDVLTHLSNSDLLNKWRQQRLGEVVGRIASAISQTGEGNSGALTDVKSLLEKVCLTLEKDIDIDISRAFLDGPLFDITTDWDRFVTCLMELLAVMRLELSQEFSQPVDAACLLQKLHDQPLDYLLERLRGCEMHCPSCKAPCEVDDRGHEVHKVWLHRPKGLLPPDFSVVASNTSINTGFQDFSEACDNLTSPDLSICSPGSHSPSPVAYWRYVLAKFSEQKVTHIPEEWRKITQEEALDSLEDFFQKTAPCDSG